MAFSNGILGVWIVPLKKIIIIIGLGIKKIIDAPKYKK